jgi:hypothetical protein
MPASSEIQIYSFENNIERAVQSVLGAAGLLDVFIQGANATLPESRIEIMFSSGEAMNESTYPLDTTQHIYDFFSGRLQLRIVTVRPDNQPSLVAGVSNLHEEWCANVRKILQERNSPFTASNLPYYAIKTIRPLGTQRDLDPRWLEDYTRLDFLIEFGIRSDAWPS